MYYPFVRGKQFELLMLREQAPRIADWGFIPIIEPVKKNLSMLRLTLEELTESGCQFILIFNPSVGEMKNDSDHIYNQIINGQLQNYHNYSVGINLSPSDSLASANVYFDQIDGPISIIHGGFSDGKSLAELIANKNLTINEHIFIEKNSSRLYRKHFDTQSRILVEDGFISRNNREYPPNEPFSEIYLTYEDAGCQGFGDFLMVGRDFKEGGGPAYAVAIHITYVDSTADNAISIKHFISDDVDTTKDPASKYMQALRKLYECVHSNGSEILQTSAIEEYMQLYEKKHFPGLGYIKKLSMQHHLELMAHTLANVS